MASITQSSFAGGETAPTMYARRDLQRYGNSVRKCRNFIPIPQGPADTRPGFRFIAETKNSGVVRLIPFSFADNNNFVLEFGENYIRFYQNGAVVVTAVGSTTPYEVVTTYAAADLARLKFAQVGDVITIVHASYAPKELRRVANSPPNWTLNAISFTTQSPWFPYAPSVYTPSIGVADASHPLKEWQWAISTVGQLPDGTIFESSAQVIVDQMTAGPGFAHSAVPTSFPLYTDKPITLSWGNVLGGLLVYPPYKILEYRIYRGRNGIFGYIGSTAFDPGFGTSSMTTMVFHDDAQAPDYTQAPPQGSNPFLVTLVDGTTSNVYPSVVSIFEQRRVFAGFATNPQKIVLSRTNNLYNFDINDPPRDDGALNFSLSSQKLEEIRWITSLRAMLIGTGVHEWAVGGSQGAPISPTSVDAKVQSAHGSSWLDPIVINNTIVFVKEKGNSVRDFVFDFTKDQYNGSDLTLTVPHFFLGFSIVDWAYQTVPNSIIWSVRNDGSLLGLTIIKDQEMLAWHLHNTLGTFENVCSVSEGTEDGLYVVVNRVIGGHVKRYVERLESRYITDSMTSAFLDACSTYNGVPTTLISGLSYLEGQAVYVAADGNFSGPYMVAAGKIDISADYPDGVSKAHVGLYYLPELELLDLNIPSQDGRTKLKNVRKVSLEVTASRGLWVGESQDTVAEADINFEEWEQREVSDSFDPIELKTGIVELNIESSWNKGGRVLIQQKAGLPLTVMSATREVEFGDD
jgi:hypothetical protein